MVAFRSAKERKPMVAFRSAKERKPMVAFRSAKERGRSFAERKATICLRMRDASAYSARRISWLI